MPAWNAFAWTQRAKARLSALCEERRGEGQGRGIFKKSTHTHRREHCYHVAPAGACQLLVWSFGGIGEGGADSGREVMCPLDNCISSSTAARAALDGQAGGRRRRKTTAAQEEKEEKNIFFNLKSGKITGEKERSLRTT